MTGHLIHVGFPKTASNFLRRWFREHPQLAYVEGGIAGYANIYEVAREAAAPRDDIRYRVTSAESLVAPNRDTGKQHLTYDAIDPAEGQQNACAALHAIFPGAHVLIVTRGFRSMIFSSFSQYIRSGATLSFEEFVKQPMIDRAWDYDRVIGMYREAFGADKVIVIPWEMLRDDVDAFVRVLEQRLGLDHFAPSPGRLNSSLSGVELYWYPRLTRIVRRLPIGPRLERLYLRAAFVNRFRRAIALVQRVRPAKPVTADAVPEALIETYRSKAKLLDGDPLYARYAVEYLESEPAGPGRDV